MKTLTRTPGTAQKISKTTRLHKCLIALGMPEYEVYAHPFRNGRVRGPLRGRMEPEDWKAKIMSLYRARVKAIAADNPRSPDGALIESAVSARDRALQIIDNWTNFKF